MKKILSLAIGTLLMTACSNDGSNGIDTPDEQVNVTLHFTGYEVTPMSKATTSVSEVISRLDVWLYESGTQKAVYHQQTGDEGFGTLAVTLDKTKTYTLYAVGHKGADVATLTDGVVAFPDDYTTQTLWYTETFSPATVATLSCEMTRIVGQFSILTTDKVPEDAAKCRIEITSAWTRWNVGTLAGTNAIDRTHTWNTFSVRSDGTAQFNAWIISTDDAPKNHDITVTFLNDGGDVIQSRTFESVPIRNGYKTTYRGSFFIDTSVSATFTVDAWNEYDEVAF